MNRDPQFNSIPGLGNSHAACVDDTLRVPQFAGLAGELFPRQTCAVVVFKRHGIQMAIPLNITSAGFFRANFVFTIRMTSEMSSGAFSVGERQKELPAPCPGRLRE